MREITPTDLLGPLNDVEQKNAPESLFYEGRPELGQERLVSIVGSRNASDDGIRRAKKLSRILVDAGFCILSGMALGIDRAAHDAAIEYGGNTVAVLGTPLDKPYPRQNLDLFERLRRDFLVVSQFPSGYPTQRRNWPMRNRTMALMARATVIIEGTENSGTRSQAWEAIRLGREIFLAKSLVDREDLTWPREVLDYGAQVLDDPDDLLQMIDYAFADETADALI